MSILVKRNECSYYFYEVHIIFNIGKKCKEELFFECQVGI